MDRLEIIYPNPDMVAICRLYLEKHEQLTEEERDVYIKLIRAASRPVYMARSKELLDKFMTAVRDARVTTN